MIQNLFTIKNELNSLSYHESELYSNYLNQKYNFENETLQKEIGIESLKKIFLQFIKREKNFNKMDTLTIKKIYLESKKTNTQLPELISEKYDMLKHLVDKNDCQISILLLKNLYLLDQNIITETSIENQIEYIKSLSNLEHEQDKVQNILNLFMKKTKFKLPASRRRKIKKDISKEERPKKLDVQLMNQIYSKIMEEKQQIFTEEEKKEEDFYDKELIYYMETINKEMKNIKPVNRISVDYNTVKKLKQYFTFLFDLKNKSNGMIDNIIENAFFCVFDDYHVHFDTKLKELKPFSIPFEYEENEETYYINCTFVNVLTDLKHYKYLSNIIDYLIQYLEEKEYIDKFLECEESFYFANLKGFMNCINYNPSKKIQKILNKMWEIFNHSEKSKKMKKMKNNKINFFKKYNHLVDLENLNFKDFPKNEKGIISMDIEVLKEKMILFNYLKKLIPSCSPITPEDLRDMLNDKNISTFYQYKNSKYFKQLKDDVKEEKEEKKEKKKEIYTFEKFFNNYKNTKTVVDDTVDVKNNETIKFKEVLNNMQRQIDIMKFKTLFGLTIENSDELQDKYDKFVMGLSENNKNIFLKQKMETNILIMKNRIEKTIDQDKKSKLIRELKTMEDKKRHFEVQIKDLDNNGYAYGVNYEPERVCNSNYITGDTIRQGKKMEEMMKVIDTVFKKKNTNFKINTFVIDMITNYEFVNTILYETYDIYVNHNIDTIFENYCTKFYKSIREDLRQITLDKKQLKSMSLDFSRLCMIIFFIINNEDKINQIYKSFQIENKKFYLDKYVKIKNQEKIGKVIQIEGEKLYTQFDLDIEILSKDEVELVESLINKDVYILQGNYKGRIARVYEQLGDHVMVTIDTYGKSQASVNTKIRTIKLPLSKVKLAPIYKMLTINGKRKRYIVPDNDNIRYEKLVRPKNIKNQDLFSIARFLYSQVIDKNYSSDVFMFRPLYFNKIYSIGLKHVNEMVKSNIVKHKELVSLKLKKDKNYFKQKSFYEKQGLFDFQLEKSHFRLTNDDIRLFKDNSIDYINEDEIDIKKLIIHKSPEEEKAEKERKKMESNEIFIKELSNFKNSLNNLF